MTVVLKGHKLPVVVAEVFARLNENGLPYAVLRNYEGLPYVNKSRDIDIVIKAGDYPLVKRLVVESFTKMGCKLVTFFESERLRTFICGKVESGTVELVQFDFFVHTSAYGHVLLTAEELLASRVETDGVWHVSEEYQFLDKFLYVKYVGGSYPAKYKDLRDRMAHSEKLREILRRTVAVDSLEELEALPVKAYRKRCKRSSVVNCLLFWRRYAENFVRPKGVSIGFTGPDGSGKTTVITEICKELSAVYSSQSMYHFRPMLMGNLGEVAHSAGLKKEVDREYDKPHRGGKTNKVSSLLRLAYYAADYVMGYFVRVRPALRRRDVVVFDRYYTDIICDARRTRIYLPTRLLYWFGRLFIPRLDYNILLTARADTILARKHELSREGIEAINQKIDYLASKPGYYKIVNDGTPQEAVAQILRTVMEAQHRKNMKRLK